MTALISTRDTTKPLFHWYVESSFGVELVVALYTSPCRFKCAFCSLPKLSEGGEQVSSSAIERQIDWVLAQYEWQKLESIRKVSLYLAGSSLDTNDLPQSSLVYFMMRAKELPNLRVFSLETRPEYVSDLALKMIQSTLGDVVVEISIGYETHNPVLRNQVLRKGLTEHSLTRLMKLLGANDSWLKAYLMLKPHHSLSERAGVQEAINGLVELSELGKRYRVPVSIHLNPTYIAKGSSVQDEMLQHAYQPPEFSSIVEVLEAARNLELPICVSLDDEGLSVTGETFRSSVVDPHMAMMALKEFNRHQNVKQLIAETGLHLTKSPVAAEAHRPVAHLTQLLKRS